MVVSLGNRNTVANAATDDDLRWRDEVRFEVPRDFQHNGLEVRRGVVDASHSRHPRKDHLSQPLSSCSGDRIGLAVGERIDKHRPEPPDEGESHPDNHDRHHDDRSGRNHRPHRHAAATDAHPRDIPEVALDQSGSWHTSTSTQAIDIADLAPGLTEHMRRRRSPARRTVICHQPRGPLELLRRWISADGTFPFTRWSSAVSPPASRRRRDARRS